MSDSTRMDRRDFLKVSGTVASAAVALAGGVAPARAADEKPAAKWNIKKTLKIGMVKEKGTLLDKFKMLKEIGFDGIELDAPNDLDEKEVLEARDKSGLVINGVVLASHWKEPFSSPDQAVRERSIEALKRALNDAKAYGATSVLVVPGVVGKEVPYMEAYLRSHAAIRQTLPTVEKTGVSIAFENVWNNFLLSPLEAARYCDEFKSPLVRWHFDIGNVVRYGWPEHWIQALGKRIFKLDTKGFSEAKHKSEGPWKGFDVEIGAKDDSVDYKAVNQALRDIGYTEGWLAAEVKGGNRERLVEISKQLTDVLAR